MKIFILFLATVSLVAGEGQTHCTSNEIFLPARDTCCARCTANHGTCGGGDCEVLPDGGTGIRSCVCWPGFKNSGTKALCVPDCSLVAGCQAAGGRCDAPGVCNCQNPAHYFQNRQCVPKPECNGDCYGKLCDQSGCRCAPGYYALVNGKCKPTCQGKCDASKGLECVDPNVCSCIDKTKNVNAYGECVNVIFVNPPPTRATTTTVAVTTPVTTRNSVPTTLADNGSTITAPTQTGPPIDVCNVCQELSIIRAQNDEILALLKSRTG